ncbi:MAG TPA: D-amino acid dehydrogenase [Dongiaceae bacterium]|jgi:D-amino-acid dehydrogenase|nr:D-amino acid dehydrogenase [Dongiaceae bacterium]
MKILVLGGGLLGVTSAYYLARDGHEVTVIDRQAEPARETSYANASLISPGHAYAWARPSAPWELIKSLVSSETALRYRLRLDPAQWRWSLAFLKNCTRAKYRRHTAIKLRLCVYSQEQTREVSLRENLSWDNIQRGLLYLFRDANHLAAAEKSAALLRAHGIEVRALTRDEVVAREPALQPIGARLVGALYAPGDESGDARRFTLALAERCREMGVQFLFGRTVTHLRTRSMRIEAVETDAGSLQADRYVLAFGSYSAQLLAPLRLNLPLYPIKGYSATFPIIAPERAPSVGGVDESYLIAFSRLGERLRMTGTAEFTGYDTTHTPRQFTHLIRVAKELFPEAADYTKPDYWACLRPTTADGPPVIGPSPYDNLWLNTGHGHLGWTMACGSAHLLADMLAGRKPAIETEGLTYGRYA